MREKFTFYKRYATGDFPYTLTALFKEGILETDWLILDYKWISTKECLVDMKCEFGVVTVKAPYSLRELIYDKEIEIDDIITFRFTSWNFYKTASYVETDILMVEKWFDAS